MEAERFVTVLNNQLRKEVTDEVIKNTMNQKTIENCGVRRGEFSGPYFCVIWRSAANTPSTSPIVL